MGIWIIKNIGYFNFIIITVMLVFYLFISFNFNFVMVLYFILFIIIRLYCMKFFFFFFILFIILVIIYFYKYGYIKFDHYRITNEFSFYKKIFFIIIFLNILIFYNIFKLYLKKINILNIKSIFLSYVIGFIFIFIFSISIFNYLLIKRLYIYISIESFLVDSNNINFLNLMLDYFYHHEQYTACDFNDEIIILEYIKPFFKITNLKNTHKKYKTIFDLFD